MSLFLTKNTCCGIIVTKGDTTMTYEEYEQIISDYAKDNSLFIYIFDNLSARRLYEEHNVTLAECNATILHEHLVNLSDSKRVRTIEEYVVLVNGFYEYLIANKIRSDNPMADARNSLKALIAESSKRQPYYSSIDINYILSTLTYNKALYTALILTFYEGVAATAPELAELNYDDVDFEKSTIKMARGVKKISERLCKAYKEMHVMDYTEDPSTRHSSGTGTRRTTCYLPRRNALFVTTRKDMVQFCSSRFEMLSNQYGTKITSIILYYDGFIDYCVNQVGVNAVIQMFDGKRMTKEATRTLDQLSNEYCLIYRDKGKYQLTPFVNSLMIKTKGLDYSK